MVKFLSKFFKSERKLAEENLIKDFYLAIHIEQTKWENPGQETLDSWVPRLLWDAQNIRRRISKIQETLNDPKFKSLPDKIHIEMSNKIQKLWSNYDNIMDTIAEAQ